MIARIVCPTAGEAARSAAQLVTAALRRNPSLVLGLPTGRTTVPLYAALVREHRRGRVSFRRATSFNLDEFRGLGADDPRSFHAFLVRHLFGRVDQPPARLHLVSGQAPNWRREAWRIDRAIREAGGFDLCLLGIGRNGHIAFNEPCRRLKGLAHLARLTRATRRDNASSFGGRWRAVPTAAINVGMDVILNARRVVLVATGRSKASIVRRALEGPVTPRVPASLLQRHPNVTVILDRAAARR